MYIDQASATFSRLNEVRSGQDGGGSYIRALYHFLFQKDSFQNVWDSDEDSAPIIHEIVQALSHHFDNWNSANETSQVAWELKADGDGWLGLKSQELEKSEFAILRELWEWCLESVTTTYNQFGEVVVDPVDDAAFFDRAEAITENSLLFQLLKNMEIIRPNGKKKQVWPHVKDVVTQLDSTALHDFGSISGEVRRAQVRMTAYVHDLVNVVAIDNDWLQLHAHGAAAFIYRFFVKEMDFTAEEAASIVRVIDFHHLLQLQILEGIDETDRVIAPNEVAQFFAEFDGGLEELGRLILFSLADVGTKRPDFRSEHIAASLGLIDAFVNITDGDEAVKVRFAEEAIIQAALAIEQLNLLEVVDAARLEAIQNLVKLIEDKVLKMREIISTFGSKVAHAFLVDRHDPYQELGVPIT